MHIPAFQLKASIMITFTNPDVTIEFFSHRNPRVTVNNVSHDVWRVRVRAEDPTGNIRRWYRVNFHDHVALQAAINAANVSIHYPTTTELVLVLWDLVTFMGVPRVYVISFQYMSDVDDPTPLETFRTDRH